MRETRADAQERGDPRPLPSGPMTAAPTAGDALALVRLAASGAAGALALHASRIDDINVFPVPDGDTGANLSQTARSVVDALQANLAPEPSAIARVGARAALLGARGNSGIILSQLVRGALRPARRGRAARRPRDRRCPAARQHGGRRRAARAGRGHDPDGRARARRRCRGRALERSDRHARGGAGRRRGGARAHARLLPVAARGRRRRCGRRRPRRARARCARGAARRSDRRGRPGRGSRARAHHRGLRRARATAPASWSRARSRASCSSCRLAPLGDCLVVVCDGELVRAHLHTDDPGRALSAATTLGALSGVEISDMHAQRDALAGARARAGRRALEDDGRLADVLAVVDGDGNRVLYASLGARLLLSGRPTADELLDAMHTSPAAGIVLLPNDPGLQVVAEYAAHAAHVARARRADARARAGPRGARRLPHRPAGRRARRGARGGRGLGGQRRGAGRRATTPRRCARRSRARSRPAPRSSRCWPARGRAARRWRRSRPGWPRRIPASSSSCTPADRRTRATP